MNSRAQSETICGRQSSWKPIRAIVTGRDAHFCNESAALRSPAAEQILHDVDPVLSKDEMLAELERRDTAQTLLRRLFDVLAKCLPRRIRLLTGRRFLDELTTREASGGQDGSERFGLVDPLIVSPGSSDWRRHSFASIALTHRDSPTLEAR